MFFEIYFKQVLSVLCFHLIPYTLFAFIAYLFLTKISFFQPQRFHDRGDLSIVTGGGVMFLMCILWEFCLKTANLYGFFNHFCLFFSNFLLLFMSFLIGLVGLIDDYLKVQRKTSDGLSSRYKLVMEISILIIFLILDSTSKSIFNSVLLYKFWCFFVLLAMINGVNLTDGMDLLASITSFFCLLFLMLNASLCVAIDSFLALLFLLAFSPYNFTPAVLYMGDTGALFLGALIGGLFLKADLEWFILSVGVVIVIQTMSSFLQIIAIRMFKTRVFILAPFHHHLQKVGWSYKKVFWFYVFLTLLGFVFAMFLFNF